MYIYNNLKKASIFFILFSLLLVGCKKSWLDEYNPASRTTDNYYTDPVGYEGLVTSCYPLLRDITQQRNLTIKGTDIFTAAGWSGIFYNQANQSGNPLDQYDARFNSSNGSLQGLWDVLYREINRCNAVIGRADAVVGMDATKKTIRVSEAKFLRSLCYFWAVQQWGDIPMPLLESLSGSLDWPKNYCKRCLYTNNNRSYCMYINITATQCNRCRSSNPGSCKVFIGKGLFDQRLEL